MIRDITIGQYYPAQSPIHRLDPRVKIVCTLIFLVSLFVQNSVLGYALAFVFLACMIHVSKVPAKFIGKGLKPIVILFHSSQSDAPRISQHLPCYGKQE